MIKIISAELSWVDVLAVVLNSAADELSLIFRNDQDQLALRRLMSYIYMEHLFLMFLDHTQRRSTVGRTPLDE